MKGLKEDKYIAAQRLRDEYRDQYGRTTLNIARQSNPKQGQYDSENQHLWTGETIILFQILGLLKNEDINAFYNNINSTKIPNTEALFARHPDPFRLTPHHNISWDEYRGIMYGLAALGDSDKANAIINEAKRRRWILLDSPYELLVIDKPHKLIPKWVVDLKYIRKIVLTMSSWKQPKERAFYQIVAKEKPNIINLIFLGLSFWLTSRKPKEDTSGKLIAWYTIKAIEIIGFKSNILNFFIKKFDKNMKELYNKNSYIVDVAKLYFKDENHPFHTLIKELNRESN